MTQEEENLIDKFNTLYDQEIITEWLGAYINYPEVKKNLYLLKNIYDRHHLEYYINNRINIKILLLKQNIELELLESLKMINKFYKSGEKKFELFIEYKQTQIIYFWHEMINSISQYDIMHGRTHQAYEKKAYIKTLTKIIYANIQYLKEFIYLNEQIMKCICSSKEKYARVFLNQKQYYEIEKTILSSDDYEEQSDQYSQIINERINQKKIKQQIKMNNNQNRNKQLNILEAGCKSLYSSLVYLNKKQELKLEQFTRFSIKQASHKNHFLLGLYIGLGSVIFCALIILFILNLISFSYNDNTIQSMNYVFPMFRGVGLLILYLWGMAWNVYGFTIYKINFKNILEYGQHYSNHFQIMKRAGFFTLVFCLMLFIYLLGLQINSTSNVNIPIQYAPFIVWFLYFLNIFFPNSQVLNPKGRRYFYNLLKKVLLTPIVKMSFLISYASDQAVSFVIPIKDFAYTICYYTSQLDSLGMEDTKQCLSSNSFQGIIIAYGVALIPLIFRMIQCFNQAKQTTGKFIGHIQMWNFFKYFASVVTVTISFLSTYHPNLFTYFIISSILSTLYSYYWDLVNDWGFFQKNSKYRFLRNNICYKNPKVYYFAICINLIFRCSWTLSISPSVVNIIPKSTFLPFLTGFIEILRRCMWNFFRVQKEHVINCQNFSIIKQKPEDLLKLIRLETPRKSFRIGEETDSSIIPYVKFSDEDDDSLKKLCTQDLPVYSKAQVEEKKLEFMKAYKIEVENTKKQWIKQLKGRKFNILQKFY